MSLGAAVLPTGDGVRNPERVGAAHTRAIELQ